METSSSESRTPETRIGYMCAVDYEHHLENDSHPQKIYPDMETLLEERKCVQSCGAVKVEIKVIEEISNRVIQDYMQYSKSYNERWS